MLVGRSDGLSGPWLRGDPRPRTRTSMVRQLRDRCNVGRPLALRRLGVATWTLIARGITPLREDDLTNKVGAVNDKALTRIDDAISRNKD